LILTKASFGGAEANFARKFVRANLNYVPLDLDASDDGVELP
jgi:hypothetical protein